jgi:hypothetical protein
MSTGSRGWLLNMLRTKNKPGSIGIHGPNMPLGIDWIIIFLKTMLEWRENFEAGFKWFQLIARMVEPRVA